MTTIVLARQLEAAGINDLSARAWDEAAKSWDRLRAFPVVAIRHADEARVNKAKVTAAGKDALGFILRKPGSGPLTQAVRAFVEVLPPQTPPNAGDKDQGLRAQYVFPLIPAAVDTDSARAVLDGLDLSYQKLGAQAALAYGLAKHNRDAEALDLLRTFPDYFLENRRNCRSRFLEAMFRRSRCTLKACSIFWPGAAMLANCAPSYSAFHQTRKYDGRRRGD